MKRRVKTIKLVILILLLLIPLINGMQVETQAGTITQMDLTITYHYTITTIDDCLLDKHCRQDFCQEYECFKQHGAWYYALK